MTNGRQLPLRTVTVERVPTPNQRPPSYFSRLWHNGLATLHRLTYTVKRYRRQSVALDDMLSDYQFGMG